MMYQRLRNRFDVLRAIGLSAALFLSCVPTVAQEASNEDKPASATASAKVDPRFAAFQKMLSDVSLVGHFTVDGKPMKELKEERYDIKKVEKLPDDADLWTLEARIKYGQHDVTVPMVLTVKWVDDTPMIVMDRMLIPGLGTFSARVVFHDGKYAGTWVHDNHGGHLFGRLEPSVK